MQNHPKCPEGCTQACPLSSGPLKQDPDSGPQGPQHGAVASQGFRDPGSESVGVWWGSSPESVRSVTHALIPASSPQRSDSCSKCRARVSVRNGSTQLWGKRRESAALCLLPKTKVPARPMHSSVFSSQGLRMAGFVLTSQAAQSCSTQPRWRFSTVTGPTQNAGSQVGLFPNPSCRKGRVRALLRP